MSGLEIYLAIILPLHAVDEVYHCNNIPIAGNDDDLHLICNWAEDDYEYYTKHVHIPGITNYEV